MITISTGNVGVRGGTRTPGPKFHPTSAFAAAFRRSWSGLSLHRRPKPLGVAHPVSTPSPPGLGSGLATCERNVAFPDFERIRCAVSECNAQFLQTRKLVLYPAELRGLSPNLPEATVPASRSFGNPGEAICGAAMGVTATGKSRSPGVITPADQATTGYNVPPPGRES